MRRFVWGLCCGVSMCFSSVAFAQDAAPSREAKIPEKLYGVRHLPEAHFCHDSVKVVVTYDYGEMVVKTVKQLRDEPDLDWMHIGPRRARAMFWREGGKEKAVLSCSLDGAGLYMNDVKPGGLLGYLRMSLGPVGEITSSKYISVVWAERRGPDEPWIASEHVETAFRADEEPHPHDDEAWALTDAFVFDVSDHDSDGKLEVTTMSLEVCAVSTKKSCEDYGDFLYRSGPPTKKRAYLITMLLREGARSERAEALVRADGTVIETSLARDKDSAEKEGLAKRLDQLLPRAAAEAQKRIEDYADQNPSNPEP